MIAHLLSLFSSVFLLIGFGFVLSKTGVMPEKMKNHLSTFLMKAVLPLNIISSAGQTFSSKNAFGMFQILLISGLFYVITLVVFSIATRKWNVPQRLRGVFINVLVFANVGFVGFPIMGQIYGQTGILYTIAYNSCYQLAFFTYGLFLLQENKKFSLKSMFGNSIIYISIASILLYISPFRFPAFLQSTFTSVGQMMTPISMIIIGWEISKVNFQHILKDKYSYIVSLCRLLIFPILLAVILKWLHITGPVAVSAMVLTALPAGSLTVIVAQEYGGDTSFAARAVAQSTLLMLVTLPFIYIGANWLFH